MEYRRFKYDDIFKVDFETKKFTATKKKATSRTRKQIPKRLNVRGLYRSTFKKSECIEFNKRQKSIGIISIKKPTMISPRVPVKIGGISIGPDINIFENDNFSGINIANNVGQDINGYIENGVLIIKGFINE